MNGQPWQLYTWGKAASVHWVGGWVGLRVGLDTTYLHDARSHLYQIGHLCWDLNHISVVVQPSHYTASLQSVMMKKLKGKGSNSMCLLCVQYWWVLILMTTVLACMMWCLYCHTESLCCPYFIAMTDSLHIIYMCVHFTFTRFLYNTKLLYFLIPYNTFINIYISFSFRKYITWKDGMLCFIIVVYQSVQFYNSCHHLLETKRHSSLISNV